MISFPPCKINLGLNIISKRSDGYHNIETCFYPVPWTDILEVIPSAAFSFTVSGNPIPGKPEDNLCVKAYALLKKDFGLPAVNIHLHKIIPAGAGLGGGSSDAAHTLRLLNQTFDLTITPEKLQHYAAQLGSDCAFFIHDNPQFGTGRGEVLGGIKLSLKGKHVLIVTPNVHISTADAYAGVFPSKPEKELKEIIEKQPVDLWKSVLTNDFEVTVFRKFLPLSLIREKMYSLGAVYASMSGSGSAIFGIFNHAVDIQENFLEYKFWMGELRF